MSDARALGIAPVIVTVGAYIASQGDDEPGARVVGGGLAALGLLVGARAASSLLEDSPRRKRRENPGTEAERATKAIDQLLAICAPDVPRTNPSQQQREVEAAYKDFHWGEEPDQVEEFDTPDDPELYKLGDLISVVYETAKGPTRRSNPAKSEIIHREPPKKTTGWFVPAKRTSGRHTWDRRLVEQSGVYAVRDRDTKEILYVGSSHKRRLRYTLSRKFQSWPASRRERDEHPEWSGEEYPYRGDVGHRGSRLLGDPLRVEVRVWYVPSGQALELERDTKAELAPRYDDEGTTEDDDDTSFDPSTWENPSEQSQPLELWEHHFQEPYPALTATADGELGPIVGGGAVVTERGIEG